jgi:hypothetical protein
MDHGFPSKSPSGVPVEQALKACSMIDHALMNSCCSQSRHAAQRRHINWRIRPWWPLDVLTLNGYPPGIPLKVTMRAGAQCKRVCSSQRACGSCKIDVGAILVRRPRVRFQSEPPVHPVACPARTRQLAEADSLTIADGRERRSRQWRMEARTKSLRSRRTLRPHLDQCPRRTLRTHLDQALPQALPTAISSRRRFPLQPR